MLLNEVEKYSGYNSPLHKLDARAKVLVYIALIVISVSTPINIFWAFVCYGAVVLISILISRVPARYYLARFLLIIPFVLLVTISLPFMQHDMSGGSISPGIVPLQVSRTGLMIFLNVLVKAAIGILALSVLSATTPFPKFIKALEYFRVPRIFTLLAGFTYRYIFVLVDEVLRMKRAGDSRMYGGRWIWHTKVVGQMIGMLFLRSYERGERVYVAMVSRGFNGRYPSPSEPRMNSLDFAFIGGMAMLLTIIRVSAIWM